MLSAELKRFGLDMGDNDMLNANGERRRRPFDDVRAFYRSGEAFAVEILPVGTTRVFAWRATGEVVEAEVDDGAAFTGLGPGTYSIEALRQRRHPPRR